MTQEHPGFSSGAILGERFRIVRLVGRGGMGDVYEALDLKLHRSVALKCARPGYCYRLPPEARAAREVSHFNVCKVHELHTFATSDGEIDCLSMEFIEGETLSKRVRDLGPVSREMAREIGRQICAGVAQAHRQGVVHADLKCGNVILARSPEGHLRAVVTDFGLARLADVADEDQSTGGTYEYMAPEIFLGEPPNVASDIYALGVLFHVMLTGHAPRRVRPIPKRSIPAGIQPDESTRTFAHGFEESDWRREIDSLPLPWRTIVPRCIAPRPEKRPVSVVSIAKALEPRRWFLKSAVAVVAGAALVAVGREWRNQMAVTPIRLSVLPFGVEGDPLTTAAGISVEVAERLSGARRRFTVLSPREAVRNQVTRLDDARTVLGATHVLHTQLRVANNLVSADAALVDLASGRTIQQLRGSYAANDSQTLAKALVAMVTEAFHLPARPRQESMNSAAYPYYVQGIDLLRADDAANADRAIPLFTKAIELDPRSALPYAGLAEAQIQKSERGDGSQWLDAAEATVAKAASFNPDSVPVLLAGGFVQQQHGRYEQAMPLLTRATELAPDDSEPWRRLAQCYERANRPDDAVATYQKAIQAQPDYYRHYLSLGTFYFNRGQFSRSEEQYRRVVAIAPGLGSGHMNLGLALMQQAKFAEAETQLLQALKLRTSGNLLMNIGGLYYAQERYLEASDYFEKSLQTGATAAVQFRDLGDAYRHLGRTKDAHTAYERAKKLAQADIERNPRRGASHSALGLVNAFLGDRDAAEFELSQAVAMDAENRSVIRDAAIAYEFMGRRKSALAVLSAAPKSLLEELYRNPDMKTVRSDAVFQQFMSAKSGP